MNSNRAQHDPDRLLRWFAAGGLLLVCVLLLALCGRLVQIHERLAPSLRAEADRRQQSRCVIPARRGTIFDRAGRIVAISRHVPDLFVDPGLVENVDALSMDLAVILPESPFEIASAIREKQQKGSRYLVLGESLEAADVEAVARLKNRALGITERAVRTYPLASSMVHVLGFAGREGKGLEGVELSFDSWLQGKDGRRVTIRDAKRRPIWRSETMSRMPEDGCHLVLTLDAEIQRFVEHALARQVEALKAEDGMAIVMVPHTGEVLAMASLPSFDPSVPGQAEDDSRRNRCLREKVEPGSTFKPFIVTGALEAGVINCEETFDGEGGSYRVTGRTIRDVGNHGTMKARDVVVKSSNVGMAKIGQRMGAERLYETMKRFGFGERTGIDLPGEGVGVVHPLKDWGPMSVTSVPMGYEVCVTPLQLMAAFCGLINDGVMLKPRIVKAILSPDGKPVARYEEALVLRRVASVETSRWMREDVLVGVVNEGSGKRARLPQYQVLGKTGTAKLLCRDCDKPHYESGAYRGSFIGAAPARDPAVAVLVMITRPDAKIAYYGSQAAAPVVGEILEYTLRYLGVPPDPPDPSSREALAAGGY